MNKSKIEVDQNLAINIEFQRSQNPSTQVLSFYAYLSLEEKTLSQKHGKRLSPAHGSSPPLLHANVHRSSRPEHFRLYHNCFSRTM